MKRAMTLVLVSALLLGMGGIASAGVIGEVCDDDHDGRVDKNLAVTAVIEPAICIETLDTWDPDKEKHEIKFGRMNPCDDVLSHDSIYVDIRSNHAYKKIIDPRSLECTAHVPRHVIEEGRLSLHFVEGGVQKDIKDPANGWTFDASNGSYWILEQPTSGWRELLVVDLPIYWTDHADSYEGKLVISAEQQ